MATYVRQQQVTQRIGAAGRLQIKVTDADVRIRPADGDEVRLNATFEIGAGSDEEADRVLEAAKLAVSSGGSYLDVRSNEEGDLGATIGQWITGEPGGLGSAIRHWVTGRPRVELSLEVEAPRGCELRLEAVSGDLVVEGMAGEQRYSTVSGDLEIEGEPAADGEHRIESVSGDLLFGLVGNATFDVRGIATDIHADMPHRVEGRMDRRRVVIGNGGPTVIFSSMSGDIAVRHPRRAAERQPKAASIEAAGETPANNASLEVLRALERGEIDVEEASRRLAGGSTDA